MSQQPLTLTAWQRRRLRIQLHQTQDARLYRRTLAILEVSQGQSPTQVARSLGVSRRMVYYWIEDYTQRHDPADLILESSPGRPTLWTQEARTLVQELLTRSPTQRGYSAVNWSVPLLQEELRHATGTCFSDDTIRRQLHRLGYVWKRPRYILDPDPELEKKTANLPANSGLAASERAVG
jgi:transposase